MDTMLDARYRVRAPREQDAEEVHALLSLLSVDNYGEPFRMSVEELHGKWRKRNLALDAWLVTGDGGEVVAFADVYVEEHVQIYGSGGTHPDHRGRGIGTQLVRLQEARAREHIAQAPDGTRVVLLLTVSARNLATRNLLEHEDFTIARYIYTMSGSLGGAIPAPEWPDGITVRTLAPGEDARTFYDVGMEAFADHWGFVPVSFETWQGQHIGEMESMGRFDRSLWFLATEGGEPVGSLIGTVSGGTGWVSEVGVRAPWRRRGIGMALLRHAARTFQERGLDRWALAVDTQNADGATRLYERAGMHVERFHAVYEKELRPGLPLPG